MVSYCTVLWGDIKLFLNVMFPNSEDNIKFFFFFFYYVVGIVLAWQNFLIILFFFKDKYFHTKECFAKSARFFIYVMGIISVWTNLWIVSGYYYWSFSECWWVFIETQTFLLPTVLRKILLPITFALKTDFYTIHFSCLFRTLYQFPNSCLMCFYIIES